jgi:hypothetical protein
MEKEQIEFADSEVRETPEIDEKELEEFQKEEEAKHEEKKPEPRDRALVETNERGLLEAKTIEGQYRIAQYYVKSGMLPQQYKSPEMVITGIQYAKELGLAGLVGLRQISVINGTPSIWGDLPAALVKKSGKLEYMKEYIIDKDSKEICLKNKNLSAEPFGAVCEVKRKGEKEPVERYFTIEDAKKANLLGKKNYQEYLKTMLKYRARSMALKDCFPDMLNGISITEYDYHSIPKDERGVTEATSEEIRQDVETNMDDGKMDLITDIELLFRKLKSNHANKVKDRSKYLHGSDYLHASIDDLITLRGKLNNRVEAKKKEKK